MLKRVRVGNRLFDGHRYFARYWVFNCRRYYWNWIARGKFFRRFLGGMHVLSFDDLFLKK
jgi:hypothetical protein